MRRILPILLACLVACTLAVSAGDGKQKHSFAFHAEARPQDGGNRTFPHTINGIEKHFQMTPNITHMDFTAFVPFRADDGATFGAVFVLNHRGTLKLMQWTTSKQGTYMAASVDMQLADYVIIDRPIKDGVVVLWRGLTPEHIEYLQKELKLKVLAQQPEKPPGR